MKKESEESARLTLQTARPGYNMQRSGTSPSTSPSPSPSMLRAVASRAKNDDSVSESTRVMRYLKQQQEEEEQKEKAKQARLRHDQLDSRYSCLQSTGLLNEIHTVFTLGACAVAARSEHPSSSLLQPARLLTHAQLRACPPLCLARTLLDGITADRDTNGTLDMDELKLLQQCMRELHPDLYPHPLTPAIAEKVVGSILDTDGDGVVDRGEWVDFITKQAAQNGERPMLKLMQTLGKRLATKWAP